MRPAEADLPKHNSAGRKCILQNKNIYKLKLKKAYNIDYAIDEIVKIKNNTYCRTIYSSNSYKIKMNSIIIILFLIFRFR